jgi:Tol biopolymer transport system component
MFCINNQENHARQLLGLTLATAMLTGIFAVTSYSAAASRPSGASKANRATNPLTQPQTPALKANGKIAFVSNRDGNNEIYVMDADGSNQTRLTNNPADDSSPAWSPDGARIVFTSNRDGNLEIYAMNADGSNQTRLTNNSADDVSPDWSPDGMKIVFVRGPGSSLSEIFVMNADGSGEEKITEGDFYTPVWSPDGTQIAFGCSLVNELTGDICVINAIGSDLRHLTQAPFGEFNYSPAWSPDGAKILFVQDFFVLCGFLDFPPCTDNGSLFVMNADGSNPQRFLSSLTINNTGWSPDGTRITFNSAQSGSNPDIFVADSSGTGLTNLSNHPAHDFDPAWGPLRISSSIDDPQFFVRQHYRDFLNREPDADGLAFWTNEITSCGSDVQCIDAKRVNVSASYFLSIEFQRTGYLVYRFYKASYGNVPGAPVPLRLNEFLPDTREIGQGVVVNQSGWEQLLETNEQAFATEFVQRPRFASAYPTSMSSEQFVDALFTNAGVTPAASDRAAAINEFPFTATTNDVAARARALRRVAENSTLAQQEFNRAFVLMQYFGYLRRNPNDAPEPTRDFAGYNFWLNKLDRVNGNFQNAEMVRAFIISGEYRHRFGP